MRFIATVSLGLQALLVAAVPVADTAAPAILTRDVPVAHGASILVRTEDLVAARAAGIVFGDVAKRVPCGEAHCEPGACQRNGLESRLCLCTLC